MKYSVVVDMQCSENASSICLFHEYSENGIASVGYNNSPYKEILHKEKEVFW